MADIFEDKTKMPPSQSKVVVSSSIDEPEKGCFANNPGLCKHDYHIQHAPIPQIGAKG